MTGKAAAYSRRTPFQKNVNIGADIELNRVVSRFLAMKDQSFSVSGSIPILETDPIILFFRTSVSRIMHHEACGLPTNDAVRHIALTPFSAQNRHHAPITSSERAPGSL